MRTEKRYFFLFIFLVLLPSCGGGGGGGDGGGTAAVDNSGTISLAWDASPDASAVGYWVYYGTSSGIYRARADTGRVTGNTVEYTLTGLSRGQVYYLVVSAYDHYRNESDFSNEVSGVAR